MSDDLKADAGAFAVGSRVGKYLLEEQIGHGGMAAVFKARDEQLGRLVALKIMAPALAGDQAFRQRFIRESWAAAKVDDPHIIPLFDAGEANGLLFIAMRYVRGRDVGTLLQREGPLPPERVAAIVTPVAAALDAAHAAGLVHRDVKPTNMLLDAAPGRPDHVYLSDFGLSKDAGAPVGLTSTGQFLGTVDYAAPEQINGQDVDGRADQYALGCAAFEMLCGEPPFRRENGMAVLGAHLSQPPPPLTTKRAGLPAAVDVVFARVLAKSAQDRYRTCAEFSDALRDALAPQPAYYSPTHQAFLVPPPPVSPHPTQPYPEQPVLFPRWDTSRQDRGGSQRWPVTIALCVVVAAVIAGAIIFWPKAGHSPPAARGKHSSSPGRSSLGRSSAATKATWTPYQDPGEFTIDLPPGWSVLSNSPGEVRFSVSPPGFVVIVAWTHSPKPDAFADWQQQSAAKASADSSYHRISIRHVRYRGYNAADWKFTDDYPASPNQFIDRGFVVHPGTLGFAIELYGPVGQWQSVYASLWQKLLASFRPAS